MGIQWKMIDTKHFVAIHKGYTINVRMGWLPLWFITKDGEMIDECYKHPPTKCELSCKVQAEKVLNAILQTQHTKQ